MTSVIKTLAVLWTLAMVAAGVIQVRAVNQTTSEARTSEEIMRENPGMDLLTAIDRARSEQVGRGIGGACCLTFGLPITLGLWTMGMVGLGITYLLFRPKPAAPGPDAAPDRC